MRTLGMVAVVLSVGCASQTDTMFTHQGQVVAQSNGLVLSDDGNEGMAGMYGTTCVFNARNGQMGSDYDIEGPDEVVEDSNGSGIVLTRSSTGIHEIAPYGSSYSETTDPNSWDASSETHSAFSTTELEGVLAARWLGDIAVALVNGSSGCAMHYLGDSPAVVPLNTEVCDQFSAIEVGLSSSAVFISTTESVLSIREGTVSTWETTGVESLSWDESTQTMYTVRHGSEVLQARRADGVLLWEATTAGISSMSHLGPHGKVATMEQDEAGRGLLVVRDSQTGTLIEATSTPAAGHDMTVSRDGSTLAIAVQEYIHLFSIN